ncbi:MAG: tetratricopeptide repeat protein [Cyclobacteriaceae bacterium]|nr:tetratricopeptide repeat protein [Cyclobacteriaceae bacterium HetDA_MAG_MS6]
MFRIVPVFICIAMLIGCLQTERSNGQEDQTLDSGSINDLGNGPIENNGVTSLLGATLPPLQFSKRVRNTYEANLVRARQNYELTPDSIDNIIWYGRRLAYLGRFQDAIRIYSGGILKFPNDPRIYRHRGHRYLTTRQFDRALDDFQRAAFFSRDKKNEIEPDGIPNRLNKPLSNTKFNIWYHLGLSYYFKGDYDKAISSFKKCMEVSDNDDLKVATTNWFYMTYQKIGNVEAANELLIPIQNRLKLVENQKYHDLLLLYKGSITPEKLLRKAEDNDNNLDPTLGYGIGNWYLSKGQVTSAREIFDRVLAGSQWNSFGYIAAEKEKVNLASVL